MQHELLQTGLTLAEAKEIQKKYSQILMTHKPEFIKYERIKRVAGVDISYYKKGNEEWGIACAASWNLNACEIENYCFSRSVIEFGYKTGFLGFRECNLIAKAIELLPETPDIIMCDGHGIIHPKRFGEAVQLGLALNIPTFGVAKNPFIGHSDWKKLKLIKSNKTPVWASNLQKSKGYSPEVLGYAICLNDGMKPVFISVGYAVKLDVALKVALKTTKDHKQPEPLHLADYLSRKEL
jgi:deoxyribonuclease V